MPFYRLKFGIVHMKGTGLTDPCAARVLIDGEQEPCMAPSAYLCDGASEAWRIGTCDTPLCEAHARQIGPNRHLCPTCHQSQLDAQQQRSLFTHLI